MGRGWKIAIGVVPVVAVLLAVNTMLLAHETKGASVTEPGGRILQLPDGELQVV